MPLPVPLAIDVVCVIRVLTTLACSISHCCSLSLLPVSPPNDHIQLHSVLFSFGFISSAAFRDLSSIFPYQSFALLSLVNFPQVEFCALGIIS